MVLIFCSFVYSDSMKQVTVALTTNSVKTLGKEMGEVQSQFKFSIEFVAGSRHYGGSSVEQQLK